MLKVLAGILIIITAFGLQNIFGYIVYEQNQNQLLDDEESKDYHFSNFYKHFPEQDDGHRRNERTEESSINLEDQNTSSIKRSKPQINVSNLNNVTVPLESHQSPLISLLVQISSWKADYDRIPNITLTVFSSSSAEHDEGTLLLPSSSSARTKRENRVVSGPLDIQERLYLRDEVQKVLNEVTFLRGSNKMPESSQQPLDSLKVKLEKLLVETNARPTG